MMILLALALAASSADEGKADDAWRFSVPAPGDPFEVPPMRALALTESKPDDLL